MQASEESSLSDLAMLMVQQHRADASHPSRENAHDVPAEVRRVAPRVRDFTALDGPNAAQRISGQERDAQPA